MHLVHPPTPYDKGKIQRVGQRELGKDHPYGLFSQGQWWVECSGNDLFLIDIKLSQSISEIDDVTDVGITMPYLSKTECL